MHDSHGSGLTVVQSFGAEPAAFGVTRSFSGRRWRLRAVDEDAAGALARAHQISPALARLFGIGWIVAHKGQLAGISLVAVSVPSMLVMLGLVVLYFHRFGSFRHPAFWLLVAAHLPFLAVVPLGDNPAVRAALTAIFQ